MFFKIEKLIMQGFKHHIERVEFDFGNVTKITGENYTGKTTIGEGVCWAIFGANLWGNERVDNALVNPNAKVTEVELTFMADDSQHSILRRRKGNKTDILLDGKKVTNNDLLQYVGSKGIFFSIFNPAYFPSLSPKEAKELLMQIIPDVSQEEVMQNLDTNSREILERSGFKNAEIYLEDRREELKETENDILKKKGFIEGTVTPLDVPDEVVFDDSELKKLQEKLDNMQTLTLPYDVSDLKEKQLELQQRITDLKYDIEQIPSDIKNLQMQIENTRSEYKAKKAKLNLLNSNTSTINCPKCGTDIDTTESEKDSVKNEINLLIERGKDINAQIDSKQAEHQKIIDSKKDEIGKLEQELANLKIDESESKNHKYINKINTEIVDIRKRIAELQEEKRKADEINVIRKAKIEIIEENKKIVEQAKTDIKTLENNVKEIKTEIQSAINYNAKKLDLQTAKVSKYLDRVTLKLYELTKSTGELRNVFKLLYDGKEFFVLSASEKIRAGLEISNLIINLLDMKLPVFIDNTESITHYKAPDTQIIETKVVAGQELKVEV